MTTTTQCDPCITMAPPPCDVVPKPARPLMAPVASSEDFVAIVGPVPLSDTPDAKRRPEKPNIVKFCWDPIRNYFKDKPMTLLATYLFSECNLCYLATSVIGMQQEICGQTSPQQYDCYGNYVLETNFFANLISFYEGYLERPLAYSDPCLFQDVNRRFLEKEREYMIANIANKALYNKYFINRTTNGSLLVFPYPTISGEQVKFNNTRGFSPEELAVRKNDVNINCLASRNRGLTDPANRFLDDYRCTVFRDI